MDNYILAHRQLKIYGTYVCYKQLLDKPDMVAKFASTEEAEAAGYRPCLKCMPAAYKAWKETHERNRDSLVFLMRQYQMNRLEDMTGYTDDKLQALYKCAKDNG